MAQAPHHRHFPADSDRGWGLRGRSAQRVSGVLAQISPRGRNDGSRSRQRETSLQRSQSSQRGGCVARRALQNCPRWCEQGQLLTLVKSSFGTGCSQMGQSLGLSSCKSNSPKRRGQWRARSRALSLSLECECSRPTWGKMSCLSRLIHRLRGDLDTC